jgi:hypothetical protein
MRPVAKGWIFRVFALTQKLFRAAVGGKFQRLNAAAGMGTIAKRLRLGFAAGAPVIGFTGFQFDADGLFGRDNGF